MKANSRAGFTLIEILAGLLVTGLFVATVMPLITQLVGRAWSGEGNMAATDEWMRADARLSSDFSEAIPMSKGNGNNAMIFSATPTKVTFVRPSIMGDRRHLDLVTVEIQSGLQGDSIIRRARPLISKDEDEDDDRLSSNLIILATTCNLHFSVPGLTDEDAPIKHLPREVVLEVEDCTRAPAIPLVFPIVARSNPVAAASAAQQ